MATRRGNKSTYPKYEPPESTHETRWRERVARGDGIRSAYDRASRGFPSKVSYEDLLAALDGLASAFGDVAFLEAAVVLESYSFSKGALKSQLLRILADARGKSADAATPIMDQFIEAGRSAREAARIAVEVTGIEGAQNATFDAVVDEVRKAHAVSRRARDRASAPGALWPSGDTGRRMKIAWRDVIERGDGGFSRTRMPPGAEPSEDGTFIVPDNRLWRRAIRDTFATVLARLPASEA